MKRSRRAGAATRSIGAVIRAERGVRLNAPLAGRVNAAISAEPTLAPPRPLAQPRARPPALVAAARRAARWRPGVAAASVLWLRAQAPLRRVPLAAQRPPRRRRRAGR